MSTICLALDIMSIWYWWMKKTVDISNNKKLLCGATKLGRMCSNTKTWWGNFEENKKNKRNVIYFFWKQKTIKTVCCVYYRTTRSILHGLVTCLLRTKRYVLSLKDQISVYLFFTNTNVLVTSQEKRIYFLFFFCSGPKSFKNYFNILKLPVQQWLFLRILLRVGRWILIYTTVLVRCPMVPFQSI